MEQYFFYFTVVDWLSGFQLGLRLRVEGGIGIHLWCIAINLLWGRGEFFTSRCSPQISPLLESRWWCTWLWQHRSMWGQLWRTGWQRPARSCCLRKDRTCLRGPFFVTYLMEHCEEAWPSIKMSLTALGCSWKRRWGLPSLYWTHKRLGPLRPARWLALPTRPPVGVRQTDLSFLELRHFQPPIFCRVKRTSGVKRNSTPLRAPFRVSPRIRKIASTMYGRIAVTYTA